MSSVGFKKAVLGDLEAARKLKWSAPRMKAFLDAMSKKTD